MKTSASEEERIRIGGWLVDPVLLQIGKGEATHRLEPKVMRLLLFLAAKAPHVVSREEILEEVWEGRAVVDEAVTRAVSLLRQAFGDDAKQARYIETIPTRGYRLIATVEPISRPISPSAATSATANTSVSDRAAVTAASVDRQAPFPEAPRSRGWLPLVLAVLFLAGLLFVQPWRGSGMASPGEPRPAIAVLPFENLSGEARDLYLSDGLTEEMIHQLAGIGSLRVVSRSSSMRFRGVSEQISEVGEELGVSLLLEGSVLVSGDRARISARLIRLEADEYLFSRTYDRELKDILSLQREVARDVVRETRVQLTSSERLRLSSAETVDPEAYRLYLQGHHAIRQRTNEGLQLAEVLLLRSVEQAPEFALAWSSLADAQLLALQYHLPGNDLEKARVTLEKALALEPERAQVYAAQGLFHVLGDQDWERAESSYTRALELEPSNSTARRRYSELLALAGRYREAVEQARLAVDLDPLSPLAHAVYGHRLNSVKRYADAARELQLAEDLGASFTWHFRELANALERLGDGPGAAVARRADIARQGGHEEELPALDRAIASSGLDGYWTWRRQRLAQFPDSNRFSLAEAYAATGATEEALKWTAEAIKVDVIWFLHGHRSPAFDALRSDPRFLELVRGLHVWTP